MTVLWHKPLQFGLVERVNDVVAARIALPSGAAIELTVQTVSVAACPRTTTSDSQGLVKSQRRTSPWLLVAIHRPLGLIPCHLLLTVIII